MIVDEDISGFQPSTALSMRAYAPPLAFSRGHHIPPKIWQILLPRPGSSDGPRDAEALSDTPSWLVQNPDYGYTLIGEREADYFVDRHFSADARMQGAWRAVKSPGVKFDLLRYLLLFIEGGVYTDTDTEALKPVDAWIPAQYRHRAKVVIGVEFDRPEGGAWADAPRGLRFCQWTIAAAPGHPLFAKMAYYTVAALEGIADERQTALGDPELSSLDVTTASSPASWTDVVLEELRLMDSNVTDATYFSGPRSIEPSLVGDILVLPIDGFGMGQPHSNSTNDGSIPNTALLRHKFRG
ncbi:putative glycosyltransferase family 32 protein [Rosellinia necatrix]|uniref:Putative glycosyltransferase family 32 protein n=1 Tax=Rosellinia necatrix TaxID=77044 RepID=A0A1W2TF21_ROSNE|nr:putative glycosyltransferase family 32 protein [Rosellinia necatrix]